MPLRPNMEPSDILEIFQRRKWWIVFSILLVLLVATVYCILVPDLFRSASKILIVPPAVAEGVVQSSMDLSTRERMTYIQQDVLGLTRLKAVMIEMGLFLEKAGDLTEDDRAALMRDRITIDVDKNNYNIYSLSFEYEDPKTAQEVLARLSSFFIEENIRGREANVQETSRFLEAQLEETRKRLETQEEKIKQYKLTYSGELPQQEQSNQNRLLRLQDQIKTNSDSIARLQDRKMFMESQLSSLERNLRGADDVTDWDIAMSGDEQAPGTILGELSMKRKQLEDAKRKYTPLHPAVAQLRWEVEQLEAKIKQLRQEAGKNKGKGGSGAGASIDYHQVGAERGELHRLRSQISTTDLEITALKRENAMMAQNINEIQSKVDRLPQREQELVALTRDYDNIKRSYDELLDKKLKVNISKNLEVNQKGERFQVLEPANLPTRPSSPNRIKVLAMALMLSLALGFGGPIAFEVLDPRLRGSKDFKHLFEVPILACLPVIHDDQYARKERTRRTLAVGGLAAILAVYVVFLAAYREKAMLIVKSIASTIGG